MPLQQIPETKIGEIKLKKLENYSKNNTKTDGGQSSSKNNNNHNASRYLTTNEVETVDFSGQSTTSTTNDSINNRINRAIEETNKVKAKKIIDDFNNKIDTMSKGNTQNTTIENLKDNINKVAKRAKTMATAEKIKDEIKTAHEKAAAPAANTTLDNINDNINKVAKRATAMAKIEKIKDEINIAHEKAAAPTANTTLDNINDKMNKAVRRASAKVAIVKPSGEVVIPAQPTSTNNNNPFSEYDIYNYPNNNPLGSNISASQAHDESLARSYVVAKYLMENGGFTAIQAAAMVGIFMDENGCYPSTATTYERPNLGEGYGAGFASWTGNLKQYALEGAGYDASTTRIEDLSLKEQCDMFIDMTNNTYFDANLGCGNFKQFYDVLRRCDNIEDATATAMILTGGTGYSDHWSTHPTTSEAQAMYEYYAAKNDEKYGFSENHHGAYERRYGYTEEIYELLINEQPTNNQQPTNEFSKSEAEES